MELVTLAHVTLSWVGSASGAQAVHGEVQRVREIPNGEPQTLREFVISIGEECGEEQQVLKDLSQEGAWDHTQRRGSLAFDLQGRRTWPSEPYAACYAHPASKIGGVYSRLEEIGVDQTPSGSGD